MYDFDRVIDRRNTNSLKWDIKENELPLWVADMDFEVCPDIVEAIQKRTTNKIFGYNILPDEWYESYINWWKERHNFKIDKEWIIFSTGVVASISSIVRKLTNVGDKVLIQTPVYNIFFNSILNNNRIVLESPLVYKDHQYSIDFNDLEKKLSDPLCTLMILCNPHNPVGKIWDKETLAHIGGLCNKYNVTVVSDEIHCDITYPGKEYTPFASVNETCKDISITLIAPTKTFNIAGLQTSAAIVANKDLNFKVWRGINTDECGEPNTFGIDPVIAAFNKGSKWLDEFRDYIYSNKQYVVNYINEHIKDLFVVDGDATYLLWVDISKITNESLKFKDFLREETGLWICEGEEYGQSGKSFIRINIACPLSTIKDAMIRLEQGVNKFKVKFSINI